MNRQISFPVRIFCQLKTFNDYPVFGCNAYLIDKNNIQQLQIMIEQLQNEPYKDQKLILEVIFPRDFPLRPMNVRFKSKIFHPNVDQNGIVYLPILKNEWNPANFLQKIIKKVIQMIYYPNVKIIANRQAFQLHEKNIDEYNKKCIQYFKNNKI